MRAENTVVVPEETLGGCMCTHTHLYSQMLCTRMYTHTYSRWNRESPGLGTESSLSDGEPQASTFWGTLTAHLFYQGVVSVDSNQVGSRSGQDRSGRG